MILGRLSPKDQIEVARRLLLKLGYEPGSVTEDGMVNDFTRPPESTLPWEFFHLSPEDGEIEFWRQRKTPGRGLRVSGRIEDFFKQFRFDEFPSLPNARLADSVLFEGLAPARTLRLNSITLEGFRGFQQSTLSFSANPSTIFIGNNGSGKSSILDAVAMCLSWLARRIPNENSQGHKPSQEDINNDADFASLELEAHYYGRNVRWSMAEKRKASPAKVTSYYKDLNAVVKAQQHEYNSKDIPTNLPTLVYYPVNRAVLDVPRRIKTKHHFEPLETYEDALVAGGRDFRFFFEWFRERENFENESIRDDKSFVDRELEAVRQAVKVFTGLEDLRIRRRPKQRMEAMKNGQRLSVQQLSDGEKCLLALTGDLARRLALANPEMTDPLQGCGTILIDEIELHLHPVWQREIVKKLEATFPNCQFLLTTHSPIILSQVPKESVRLLRDFEVIENQNPVEGREANSILSEVMGVPIFPDETQEILDEVDALIEKADYSAARERLCRLSGKLGDQDPAIVRGLTTIDFLDDGN